LIGRQPHVLRSLAELCNGALRDGKRFVVRADEILSAFIEFKSAIRGLTKP